MESFPSQQLSLHKNNGMFTRLAGENDQVLTRKNVSTDEVLADEFILDIQGRQQQTLDPRETKRQQSAKNHRRKQDEMRRTTNLAVNMVRKERDDMVRNKFLQLAHTMLHKKHFSYILL
jgi:hypothetical protein